MNCKKMITTANRLDTGLKVFEGMMKALAIVFAIFVVLMKVFGERLVSGTLSLKLGFVKLHLTEEYGMVAGSVLNHIDVILITGCLACIVIRYVLGALRSILAPVKEGRPFEREVAVGLRKLAWITLVGGGLLQVLGLVGQMVMARSLPMDAIFSSAAIESIEYVYALDLGFVWIFCIMIFLSQIFEYGQMLQQESDETL